MRARGDRVEEVVGIGHADTFCRRQLEIAGERGRSSARIGLGELKAQLERGHFSAGVREDDRDVVARERKLLDEAHTVHAAGSAGDHDRAVPHAIPSQLADEPAHDGTGENDHGNHTIHVEEGRVDAGHVVR